VLELEEPDEPDEPDEVEESSPSLDDVVVGDALVERAGAGPPQSRATGGCAAELRVSSARSTAR